MSKTRRGVELRTPQAPAVAARPKGTPIDQVVAERPRRLGAQRVGPLPQGDVELVTPRAPETPTAPMTPRRPNRELPPKPPKFETESYAYNNRSRNNLKRGR